MSRSVPCLALLFCCAATPAPDWPQWRGPARTGHVPAGVPVPETLPSAPQVLWRTPVGFGLASPVVSGGRVFFLDSENGKEVARAADAESGKVLWSAILDETFKDAQSPAGPRCTPLADGDRIYAQSCRGELQCLNAADGTLIWRTNFVKDFGATFTGERGRAEGATRHGYTASPLIDGDHLIALVGGRDGAAVVCFDKATGAIVWKSQDDTPAYAAPVIAPIHGRRQLVVFTVQGVIGLDPADGTLLWREPVKTSLGRHAATPVVVDDMVVVSSHQAGLIGVRITKEGDGFKAGRAWEEKESAINFTSPVAVGDYLYGVGPGRDLICVNARTGKQAWSEGGFFTGEAGKAHAGLIVLGPNILALTDTGQLVMIAADPNECRELGRAQACGNNWCVPAYADGRLYVRDAKELRCVRLLP